MCERLVVGRSRVDGRTEKGQGVCTAQSEGMGGEVVEHACLGTG